MDRTLTHKDTNLVEAVRRFVGTADACASAAAIIAAAHAQLIGAILEGRPLPSPEILRAQLEECSQIIATRGAIEAVAKAAREELGMLKAVERPAFGPRGVTH